MFDRYKLLLNLLLGCIGVDAADDALALISPTVIHELSWRLRAPKEKDTEDDRWDGTDADHVSPAVRNSVECCIECIGENGPCAEEDHVDGNHAASEAGRRDLSNVERYYHAGRPNSKADTEATSAHLDNFEGRCLDDGADGLFRRSLSAVISISNTT